MKRLLAILFSMMLVMNVAAGAVFAAGEGETIRWSEVKTGVYDPFHAHTLNWSGDVLDRGGFSLTTLKIVSAKEADIVINQYGSIGANGILKVSDKSLQDPTPVNVSGFTSSLTMEKGATYLVERHDGKLAKLRIDQMSSAKASFSYVLEDGRVTASSAGSSSTTTGSTAGSQPQAKPNAPASTAPSSTQSSPAAQTPATASSPAQPVQPAQQPQTKTWSEEFELQSASKDIWPFSIHMSLNSTFAMIYEKNGKRTDYELHAAPFLHEGRSMVPLRFISEALGAKVGWRAEDQSIALITDKTTILLQINNKTAVVNQKAYELDAPPIIHQDTTVVPVRFVSEHLNMFVYYDNGSILITDTENKKYETEGFAWFNVNEVTGPPPADWQPPAANQQAASTPGTGSDSGSKDDGSALIGRWDLWIPGGFATTDRKTNADGSETITSSYVAGAAGDWIVINKDGTYEWLDLKKTYKGNWSGKGEGLITLHGGPMDSDWTMRYEGDGAARIFAWGLEYKASKSK